VLRTLWGPQPSQFSGEFYAVPSGTMAPAPVQRGGPPILLGGMAPPALRRVGRIADGWVTSSRADLSQIGDSIAIIRAAAAEAGRDADAIRVVCRGVVRAGEEAKHPGTGQRLLLSGSFGQIREDTAWLGDQGVTEVFYDLNWDPLVGSPDVTPDDAAARGADLLENLSPTA
jgi:alkanesulfonate monooxygenase SsuD/methylene tetrahydromethanopterin reductase-like flavin-dependent oxidoreductase (luciferase family)